jgi:hypothetical protein
MATPAHDDDFRYALIQGIATSLRSDATTLPPLAGAVDPAALSSFVRNSCSETLAVSFEYCDHEVTVDGAGNVSIASNR